ncbi:MAG: FHA domain-containing protein [Bdellovibrionota bacterium]
MNRVVRVQNMKLALVADSGLNVGSVYPLSETRQVIGRRLDAAIPIDDGKASRDHALVDFRNGFFYLVDLGSTNGTYVNGRRVQHATRLSLGDHLRIGNSVFKVELVRKANEGAAKHWHEPTCVELDAFRPGQAMASDMREPSSASASEPFEAPTPSRNPNLPPLPRIARELSVSVRKSLSSSLPRWLGLESKQGDSRFSKRQSLMIVLLVCGALVLSAIFAGSSHA